jgi:signal transduction histidine kinase
MGTRPPDPVAAHTAQPVRHVQAETTYEDLRRSERAIILVRWAASIFALGQVLAYDDLPYPPGMEAAALALALALPVGNLIIWLLSRRAETYERARILALGSLGFDALVASGFVWVYAFDQVSALWAVLYILPLEGAIRFRLRGAIIVWAGVTALYIGREIWGSDRYGYSLQWNSVSFRMGIGLLIALVGGLMARDLIIQRVRLTEALNEVRRVDSLRSRLISTLAHDVRSPLTTIRGTFKVLLSKDPRLAAKAAADLLRTGERQAARLERLAIDLLDLARLEHGRLELAIDDISLLETVEGALRYASAEDRFEVDVEGTARVRADAGRLEQIIVNLIVNALRHGEPPFRIEAGPPADGVVQIAVLDHGPGVPPEDRAGLFDPFRTDAEAGSVGFGLAVVKALTEAHGGRVVYEENHPRGACFRLLLPSGEAGP